MTPTLFLPVRAYVEQLWPQDVLEAPSFDAFEGIWFEHIAIVGSTIRTALLFQTELALGIPGLDAVRLVLAPNRSNTAFAFEFEVEPTPEFRILDIPIALRLDSSLFKPVRRVSATEPGQPEAFEPDPNARFVDINMGIVTLRIDSEGNFAIDAQAAISLPPTMIADTGVVIEASDIGIYLDSNSPPPGKPVGWRGIHIAHLGLYLPGELAGIVGNLSVTDAYIGNGGFSGIFTDTWMPTLPARLFGTEFNLNGVDITFVQNVLTASSIRGLMTLPFFDQSLGVDIAIGVDGSIGAALSAVQPEGVTYQSGLIKFTKENLLELTVESLGFEITDGLFTAKLSGQIKPLFGDGDLDWPTFQVKELTIDSEGNVHLDGGWLDLREQYSLDFYGFQMEITKLGFGKTEDGGKWIGFSGGLKLVDGLSVGASVEGLRIIWYEDENGNITDTKTTLNGVGVEFEVPDVLRFKGEVSYRELDGPNNEKVHRFDGDIQLDLVSLDLQVDGKLVIGSASGGRGTYTFFAIYLDVELPAGIPLFSTGLALYGMAGLFALEMEPNKGTPPNELHPESRVDEEWYENEDGSAGWYKRAPIGITDFESKWDQHPGSLGLGAGVTIGTVYDNGFTFAGKVLLVIVFPGPILLLEGKANFLKERANLSGDEEPIFRALAVLDNRAGTFLIGLDAQYKYGTGGELIDIRGGVEAFFSFSDASLWHLYLGEKEPREKRIRAEILSLFKAETYFMLDAHQLALGAWVGFDEHWKFGPLKVTLEAWLESNVAVSWKPAHFYGDLWLHGEMGLSFSGFDVLGMYADAGIAADVFDPFHLLAELSVGVRLPWPLPDLEVDITLEWGPEPVPPPLPLPLKEIAVEHLKVTTSWPLPRGTLHLPNYDRGDGFLVDSPPVLDENAAPPADLPVVPLDCRPHITFGRAINDDALVGVNPQPPNPEWERIGDPSKDPPEGPVRVRYGLKEVSLQKWIDIDESRWEDVVRKAATWDDGEERWVVDANEGAVRELFGSWAPVPAMPDGGGETVAQVKLWLWSRNPFDYTRHGGRAWEEWFTDRFADYPCVPIPDDQEFCYDFEKLELGTELISPWAHPDEAGLVFSWHDPEVRQVLILDDQVEGKTHALPFFNMLGIELSQSAKMVRFIFARLPDRVLPDGHAAAGEEVTPYPTSTQPSYPRRPEVTGTGITDVVVGGSDMVAMGVGIRDLAVQGADGLCLVAVCITIGLDDEEWIRREEMAEHLIDEMARWEDEGDVLEPYTIYRLKVVTTVEAHGEQELDGWTPPHNPLEQTEFAYFRTEGPPGLTQLSRPVNLSEDDEFDSGLNDLTRYVRQTVPATVPAAGEKPMLPRPVYRAYDVGVEFSEDYVDLMYWMARRDLGLYLYDNNNRLVRDAQGRLIVLSNRWGTTEDLVLTKSDERYVTIVNASDCATLAQEVIPRNKTLASAAVGQVLDANTVYEARLIPLLFHERFDTEAVGTSVDGPSGTLGCWNVCDQGVNDGPSHWEISEEGTPASCYIVQTSNIWGDSRRDRTDPNKPGVMLLLADNPDLPDDHPDRPSNWTDYRFNVLLRTASPEDDAIGVVFRYHEDSHSRIYYRFSMDRQGRYRRLVQVLETDEGIYHSVLKEDSFVYCQDQDYLITVEAIGDSLKVYQDGALVFDVIDDAPRQGGIGLYCWGNSDARFSDVRVDDFRQGAPVVYRFKFTTSQFANFFHHLHSFQDETWSETPQPGIDASAAVALSEIATPPSDEEGRAFEALAQAVLGSAAHTNPSQVEVTKVGSEDPGDDENALAFLVRSPEPIDWRRISLEVLRAERQAPLPELPSVVKLTDVTFGTSEPNEESVTLLLREAADLTGQRVELRRPPGPIAEPKGDPVMFVDNFEEEDRGLLFCENFDPNVLDPHRTPYPYEIVDQGTNFAPSVWEVDAGHIVQTSPIFGGNLSRGSADRPKLLDNPGTVALTGESAWTNVRIRATLRSEGNNAIGLVFRYQDESNYYCFSMDRWRNYRRLIKKVDGAVNLLWEDGVAYNTGQSYGLVIDAYDDRLLGYLDDALLFIVQDADIAAGRVGFYCWLNPFAHFEALEVETLKAPPMLWQPAFADLSELRVVDEPGATEDSSQWSVQDGMLLQSSDFRAPSDIFALQPGTYALGGRPDWKDVEISVRLRSDDSNPIGVMFRYQDSDHYYRFSLGDHESEPFRHFYRRLIKRVGPAVTVLWQDAGPYNVGQTYELTLRAVGGELRGYLDGIPLFTVHDDELDRGQVGLYCWANPGAWFERVLVADRTRRIGRWTIHDEGTVSAPSLWQILDGALLQTSNIHDRAPAGPGTYAIAGDPAWRDYRLTVRMRSDDDDAIGIILRYVDNNNYYRLSLSAQPSYRKLIKKENGMVVNTALWEDTGGYIEGEPFTLTVDAIGSHLVGYLGDVCLFDVLDGAHSTGQVGLYCWGNTGARFERVEVRRPPLEAYALLRDRFAEGDTSDWSFVDEGTEQGPASWIPLEGALCQTSNVHTLPRDRKTLDKRGTQAVAGDPTWTDVIFSARLQSPDDDAIGLLFRYTDEDNYYRFSMDSQRHYRRLVKNVGGTFTLLWEDDFAYEVGRSYELTIVAIGNTFRGYMDGVPMFVKEDSDLTTGCIGLYCWGSQDARFSQVCVYPASQVFDDWLLDESFDILIPGRWLPTMDEGDQEGPSNWELIDGELRQTSNIWGDKIDENTGEPTADRPGTYVLAGDAAWADYRVSVRLRSDDNDAIGVMIRYMDGNNYYRFSMDRHRRYRRLTKKANGVVYTLWEDDLQYILHRDYVLTLECMGQRITGCLDGMPLFSIIDDNALAAGRIGLYSWRNTGACFAEVQAAAPAWINYYTFGREERMPAGTRVQVFAGNKADAPPEEPGVVRRFIASLDEPGLLRLPRDGADLHVPTPGLPNGHTRHFLPDSDYTSRVDARVLRKADGTAFFVLPSLADSALIKGQYRLRITYRRDNRDSDPNSQVLSQAGNNEEENVTLDIPWKTQ